MEIKAGQMNNGFNDTNAMKHDSCSDRVTAGFALFTLDDEEK